MQIYRTMTVCLNPVKYLSKIKQSYLMRSKMRNNVKLILMNSSTSRVGCYTKTLWYAKRYRYEICRVSIFFIQNFVSGY